MTTPTSSEDESGFSDTYCFSLPKVGGRKRYGVAMDRGSGFEAIVYGPLGGKDELNGEDREEGIAAKHERNEVGSLWNMKKLLPAYHRDSSVIRLFPPTWPHSSIYAGSA